MAQTPNPIQVAVAGASGRMGHMLIEALRDTPECQLAGALDIPSSLGIGNDATGFLGQASGVTIESDIRKGLAKSQVLIDFTRPEGTMAHIDVCRTMGVKMVIGTTGFSDTQKAHIAEAAKQIAIVMAPNMSVGSSARSTCSATSPSARSARWPPRWSSRSCCSRGSSACCSRSRSARWCATMARSRTSPRRAPRPWAACCCCWR